MMKDFICLVGIMAGSLFTQLAYAQPATRYHWEQGLPTVSMEIAESHICVLAAVQGGFRGAGELVRVYIENGMWKLEGQSQQEGVAADALCWNTNVFKPLAPGGHEIKQISKEFTQAAFGLDEDCMQTGTATWYGNAATFITSMTGEFKGGGEYVAISQATIPTAASLLIIHTCASGGGSIALPPFNINSTNTIGGGAYSFTVKLPNTPKPALFFGPGGEKVPADKAGEYAASVGTFGGRGAVFMAPLDRAICYFTTITGEFNGGGEGVSISEEKDPEGVSRWLLTARSQSGDGTMGRARCYAFEQAQ